jgi:hypothetical protein
MHHATASALDLTQPVALTFMGVLGHVTDYHQTRSIVARLLDGLPAGSYLAINDSVNTSQALEEALRQYEASSISGDGPGSGGWPCVPARRQRMNRGRRPAVFDHDPFGVARC